MRGPALRLAQRRHDGRRIGPAHPVLAAAHFQRHFGQHREAAPLDAVAGRGRLPVDLQAAHLEQVPLGGGALAAAGAGGAQHRRQRRLEHEVGRRHAGMATSRVWETCSSARVDAPAGQRHARRARHHDDHLVRLAQLQRVVDAGPWRLVDGSGRAVLMKVRSYVQAPLDTRPPNCRRTWRASQKLDSWPAGRRPAGRLKAGHLAMTAVADALRTPD